MQDLFILVQLHAIRFNQSHHQQAIWQ